MTGDTRGTHIEAFRKCGKAISAYDQCKSLTVISSRPDHHHQMMFGAYRVDFPSILPHSPEHLANL